MEKSTQKILFISGGILVLGLGFWIYYANKESKGKGEVSSKTKKENKLVLTR